MRLDPMPLVSAWTHVGVRAGFEVLFTDTIPTGHLLRGHTTAVEGSEAWSVGYRIEVDWHWHTRRADIEGTTSAGTARTSLERIDNTGGVQWLVDGVLRSEFDGCLDVDLESSAVTNTLPIHRLDAVAGETYAVPAVFVRADNLAAERLEQEYRLIARTSAEIRFDYASPTFDFRCELSYDTSGLVVRYPGIALRTC
jgi:hypothetical protein